MPFVDRQTVVSESPLSGGSIAGETMTRRVSYELNRMVQGFDLQKVRSAAEVRLSALIRRNGDLSARLNENAVHMAERQLSVQVDLMTDGYRVDKLITPKLYQMGETLMQVLHIALPLDIYIQSSPEINAFCLPSRKGHRLVMCLYSSLVASLSARELLFVMGHEVGHALFRHGDTPRVNMDNPNFSPVEVFRLRALNRAQEISCDRIGLLACQDVRVASSAVFKISSGLPDRWLAFDEEAYARHFDLINNMADVVDIRSEARTHPVDPLRVKALIAFHQSETYAQAYGREDGRMAGPELERCVESMLAVLDPDLSELENASDDEAANTFIMYSAMMLISADGKVEPAEVEWIKRLTQSKWTSEELARELGKPGFREYAINQIEASGRVLRAKIPELKLAPLLETLCRLALCEGDVLPAAEMSVLDNLRQVLGIRPDIADQAMKVAQRKQEAPPPATEKDAQQAVPQECRSAPHGDPIEAMIQASTLSETAGGHAKAFAEQLKAQGYNRVMAARALVAWAVTSSAPGGVMSNGEACRFAITAIRVCRAVQEAEGIARRSKANPMDQQIQEFGLVSLFQRGERVYRGPAKKACVVLSVSRSKGVIVVAPVDDLNAKEAVAPCAVIKDAAEGAWPPEFR